MADTPEAGLRVLLVRHAEQELDGQDGVLTERGRMQARLLADALALEPDDRLVTSPLRRARETAAALGEAVAVDDLREFEFGPRWTWELAGKREDLALWRPEHSAGAESLASFQERVVAAFEGAVKASAGASRLVCVVHSGVLDALLRWTFGAGSDAWWVSEAYAGHTSVTELEHWAGPHHKRGAPRHTIVRRIGDLGHLPPDLVSGL